MNDLTKEELEIIGLNLCLNPKTYPIINKIQAMIQNYCEPEACNPDCYCGQMSTDGKAITECGYPPHRVILNE